MKPTLYKRCLFKAYLKTSDKIRMEMLLWDNVGRWTQEQLPHVQVRYRRTGSARQGRCIAHVHPSVWDMNEQGWDLMTVLHTHHPALSILSQNPFPLSASPPFSPPLACCLNQRSGPPWGERGGGGHVTPKNVEGLQRRPWDIRVRERGGRQRGEEIGEHMKQGVNGPRHFFCIVMMYAVFFLLLKKKWVG